MYIIHTHTHTHVCMYVSTYMHSVVAIVRRTNRRLDAHVTIAPRVVAVQALL